MTRFRQVALAVVLGGGGFACGESSSPNVPNTLVAAGGNGQSGPTGSALPNPLIVLATGADGQPFPGATVQWQVTTGVAAPNPATSVTDLAGMASTTLTLGTQPGPVAVRANAGGPLVTFNLTAVHPCDFVADYTVGAAGDGALSAGDCLVAGNYLTDFYHLDVASQLGVTVVMSAVFDAYLELYRLDGPLVAFNDDVDSVVTNSRIDAILAPASYMFAPSSFEAQTTGPYTFSATVRPQTVENCETVWVTRGVTITDSITAADCADSAGTSYGDVVAIIAFAGSVLRIAQRSGALNAELSLYRVEADSVVLAAANDDSAATTTDAFLAYPVSLSAIYLIFAGTADSGATGAYTLAISSATTASGLAPAASPPAISARTWRMPAVGWGRGLPSRKRAR